MKDLGSRLGWLGLAALAVGLGRVWAQGGDPMTGTVPAPASSPVPGIMRDEGAGLPPVPVPQIAMPVPEQQPVEIHARSLVYHPDKTYAEGGVVILLQDARIRADRIELDNQTNELEATGNVNLVRGTSSVSADRLTYNVKTRRAMMYNVVGRGSDFGYKNKQINGELFFWARTMEWDTKKMVLSKGTITTCDLPPMKWHYHITADKVTVIPGDELYLTKARFYIHDKEKIGINKAQLSLRKAQKGRQVLFPQFGYDSVEGAFMREALPFGGNENFTGLLHLDYYTLGGFGGGITDVYKIGDKGSGTFYYYSLHSTVPGASRYQLDSHFTYQFANGLNLAWYIDTSQFGVPGQLAPVNFDSVVALSKSGKHYTVSLSDSVASFSLGPQSSVSTTYSFLWRQNFSDTLSNLLNVDYTTQSTAQISTYRLHTLDHLSDIGSVFDTSLDYEFTSGTSSFYVNREPDVTLRSHPIRLEGLPFLASVSVGEFDEQPTNVHEMRTDLHLEIPEQEFRPWEGARFYAQGGYRQLFYQDGDEKYILGLRGGYVQEIGDHLTTRLDVASQDPNGFSPFQSDFFDTYQNVSGGLEWSNKDYWRFSLLSGYDVSRNLFQTVLGRMNVNLNQQMGATVAANYDVNTHNIDNIDSELRLKLSKEFYLQTYDLYDCINHRLTYNDFAITREQHDFVSQLVYRGVQNELYLQFSIKGFPFASPHIGPNQGGIIQGIPGYTSNTQGLVPQGARDAEAPYGL
ncbi:MAG TPA: LptA/OstA family protein [Candidatus Xenobia bacterium]|jgi:hypothetical protein